MTAKILEGKEFAAHIKEAAKEKAAFLQNEYQVTPCLAAIIVGEDPASEIYVRNKQKTCEELGISSFTRRLRADISRDDLIAVIEAMNADTTVHGILLQLPLPEALQPYEQDILDHIDPAKDVDGFHPTNVGKVATGRKAPAPCTPAGCVHMLEIAGIPMAGKHAVVIGRSNIVGKPLSNLLLSRDATVTVCHSQTKNLAAITRLADILIVAVGKPGFVTAEMVKPGAVVIDVGINRLPDRKIVGDVDFAAVSEVAGAITPVPGGVGKLTVAMLMKNTVEAAEAQVKRK